MRRFGRSIPYGWERMRDEQPHAFPGTGRSAAGSLIISNQDAC
jgi:hypothetical protein